MGCSDDRREVLVLEEELAGSIASIEAQVKGEARVAVDDDLPALMDGTTIEERSWSMRMSSLQHSPASVHRLKVRCLWELL